jgi:hypothetical protein
MKLLKLQQQGAARASSTARRRGGPRCEGVVHNKMAATGATRVSSTQDEVVVCRKEVGTSKKSWYVKIREENVSFNLDTISTLGVCM